MPAEESTNVTFTLPKAMVRYVDLLAQSNDQASRSWALRKIIREHKEFSELRTKPPVLLKVKKGSK